VGDLLANRMTRAARAYATATLSAFAAAVAGTNPLAALQPPDHGDGASDEPWLAPPAESGIYAIDAEARKLHAAAAAPLTAGFKEQATPRSDVRFWERDGSGEAREAAPRRSHRRPGYVPDVLPAPTEMNSAMIIWLVSGESSCLIAREGCHRRGSGGCRLPHLQQSTGSGAIRLACAVPCRRDKHDHGRSGERRAEHPSQRVPRGQRRILAELPGQPMPACAGPRPASLSGTANERLPLHR
jgi:hypothetical protein